VWGLPHLKLGEDLILKGIWPGLLKKAGIFVKIQNMKEKRKTSPEPGQVYALVTKEMTISEVVQKYPKTFFVFLDYGLHCIGCPSALAETIEEAAKVHRIDLKKFLKDLNQAAKKTQKHSL